jgi:hypothetical protein
MPPAIAQGYLKAKRLDREHGYDDLRAYFDEVGMDVTKGDPIKGRRVAEFNDMLIDEMHKQASQDV